MGYKLYHIPHANLHHTVQITFLYGIACMSTILDLPHVELNITSLYGKHSRQYPVNDITHLITQNQFAFMTGNFNAHNR